MNKLAKSIIAILILTCIFLIVFTNIKAEEAEKQKIRSEKLAEQMTSIQEAAEREAMNAERAAAMAIEAETLAMRLQEKLLNCEAGR